jgi:hypothetical protein
MIFDLAEAFKHAEVHYLEELTSGKLVFKTIKVGDLMLGRYDEVYDFVKFAPSGIPILRKK